MLTNKNEVLTDNSTYVAINATAIEHRDDFQKVTVLLDGQENKLELDFPRGKATINDLHSRLLPIFSSISSDSRLPVFQKFRYGVFLRDLNYELNDEASYIVRYATLKLTIETYLGTKYVWVDKKEKGIHFVSWRTFLKDKKLNQLKTFEENGITEESELRVECTLRIYATDASGKRDNVGWWEWRTLGHVLKYFQNEKKLSGTALYTNGERLDEKRTIASYKLLNKCELEMK